MYIVSSARINEKRQLALKEGYPKHHFHFFDAMEELTAEAKQNVEILLTYGEDLTPALIEQMPQLKWIQVLSAGMDLMPFDTIAKRDILVTNAKGIHKIQMAEYTMSMVLNMVRRNYTLYDLQKEAKWDRTVRVDEAYGKTMGIIGLGAIGTEIAKRAHAFGMKVVALKKNLTDEKPSYIDQLYGMQDMKQVMAQSDFVVVIVPHTPETTHLIGKAELNEMKSNAYLINIARGQVVDEEALLAHVRADKIAGAALDVFTEEPLPAEHPFWKEENILVTPHVSGRSPHYMRRALDIFMNNLDLYPEQDKVINRIELHQGY